jgi:hypothetical protein
MKQLIQEGSPEQARTTPEQMRASKKKIRKTIKTGKSPNKPEQRPNKARTPKRSMNHVSCYGKPK